MSGIVVAMMVSVCGLVWGGFAGLLIRAVRQEGKKAPGKHGPGP